MEQIIIHQADGTVRPLIDRLNPTNIASAKQKREINNADTVSMSIQSTNPQVFNIGDWISVFGRVYRLNRLPKVKKDGEFGYTYDLEFEGIQYDLLRAMYNVNVDTTNNTIKDVTGDSLTGDLARFMAVLIANANRVFPGVWSIGQMPESTEGDVTMSFGESDNCLAVLQSLCEKFNVEFSITSNDGIHFAINMGKVGTTLPYTFRYGRGGGLYEMKRDNVSSANVITRLYAYGSTENITCKYRGTRLLLPGVSKAHSYIENAQAMAAYGLNEAVKIFDDVKPTYKGRVTAVNASDVLQFTDANFPFDLNELEPDGVTTKYLIDGVAPKIHFNTGNLAGFEFEIHKYDHATRTFTLIKQTDERGNTFPSAASTAFQFAVTNEYKILDVAYSDDITNQAEERLREEATTYLEQNCQPKVQYSVGVSKMWLQRHVSDVGVTDFFVPGDYIHIVDEGIGVDKSIRIKAIERNILDPYSYTLTISDTVTTQIINRVISDITEIDKVLTINDLKDPAKARANWLSSREVLAMVFDVEGDYYTDKIKPESIDTMMLSVGAKAMQFGLVGVTIQANLNGNPNMIAISAGNLVHYAIEENIRTWNMAALTLTNLSPQTPYYIYANVDRNGNSGAWDVSTSQFKWDAFPNRYVFLVGVLNSVDTNTGTRSIYTMYGFTTINGRFIRTGRIQSADGETYFDLDLGEIGGIIKFTKSNGETGNVADLDDVANETKDFLDNTLPGILNGMTEQIDGKIDTWYQEDDPSTAWTTAADRQKHVGDMWYKSTTNELQRFSATFAWELITDAKAIAAYAAASQAQDTADGKRRVFTAKPTDADVYDVGDLWVNATFGQYNNELLRATQHKDAGVAFNINHWVLATKYTDNSELDDFIQNTYNQAIADLQSQLDGQIEQFFNTYDPTLANEPAASWNAQDKENHLGDLFYNTENGKVFRFVKENGVYKWMQLQDEELAQALVLAQNAWDLADRKRKIFSSQPVPPYDVADLWVNATVGQYVNEILVCIQARATGTFQLSDWAKASKYTDDSALNNFVDTTFTNVIGNLTRQIDGKVETWFTTTDPASAWTTTTERQKHVNDIWYNPSAKTLWHYVMAGVNRFIWQRITDQSAIDAYDAASQAQDTADGKRRVFTDTPVPPYDAGDLWVQGGNGDIMVCVTPRAEGASYNADDWKKASKYTDDSALNDFINGTFTDTISDIQDQVDGKIEVWFQTSDPSTAWTTNVERQKHVGDMWYNSAANLLRHYTVRLMGERDPQTGTIQIVHVYSWEIINDQKALDAYAAASQAQDTADGKRTVFVAQPTASDSYDVGDLWVNCNYNSNGVVYNNDLLRCVTAKAKGVAFSITHWALATAYDNTKTTIDGGVVTSGTIRLAGDDTTIKAGITGKGTADTAIRIWAGATEQNKDVAPCRVNQGGEVWMTNAHISGEVNATSGSIRNMSMLNVKISGALRSPFSTAQGSFDTGYSDNVVMMSSGGGWIDAFSLPWDALQSGRRITLVNYKWGSTVSDGVVGISAPSGKWFFIEGQQKNELQISREAIELLGYGDSQNFYGWIVMARIDLMPRYSYGHGLKVLAMGKVTGTTSGASLSYKSFDGKPMSVTRVSQGKYRINFPTTWFFQTSDCFVMVTPTSLIYGGSNPNRATVTTVGNGYFEVILADDFSLNDGNLNFTISNFNDMW